MIRRGTQAEDQAAEHLLKLGYTLITRRHKTKSGEIDLIAFDPDGTLVFVEVKSRSGRTLTPEQSITPTKLARIRAAAQEYLSANNQPDLPTRCDLIAITPTSLSHYKSALT
jgi:putative endonuclease